MNFYPHHIKDFNNSTRHLTRVERSVYRDAIELYYDTESALTKDFDVLARRLLCRTEDEKKALQVILSEFFDMSDDGYRNERCDIEIEKYRSNTSAKARAGIASAAKRKQNSTRVERSDKLCSTNQEPVTSNQEPINISSNEDIEVKKRLAKFNPPSQDEIVSFQFENSLPDESVNFFNYYESNGWMVGKNKMKNWKAAFSGWCNRSGQFKKNNKEGLINGIFTRAEWESTDF